jgi:hypothetical protein
MQRGLPAQNAFLKGARQPGLGREFEIEGQVQLVGAVAAITRGQTGSLAHHFAHRHPLGVTVEEAPQVAKHPPQLRLVQVVEVPLPLIAAQPESRGVLAELRLFEIGVDHVQPEAIYPALKPELHHLEHPRAHFGVAPVQVGLFLEEEMVVVLPDLGHPLPRRAAEGRLPVVRWAAVDRVVPHIPVVPRVFAAAARGLEPGVPVRRVVEHEVEDHADAARVRAVEESPEVV